MSTGHDDTADAEHPGRILQTPLPEEDLQQVSGGGGPKSQEPPVRSSDSNYEL